MQKDNNYCTIIAEAGVNHNGRLDYALQLIDIAANAGADIVKFQTFKADLLATPSAPKAEYQKERTGKSSQLEMLRQLELTKKDYVKLFEYAKQKKIRCISTPFDIISLELLMDLGMKVIKIPSGEITNGPFLLAIARKGLPVILSTGMSNLDEIESALAVLSFGYLNNKTTPASLQECLSYLKKNAKAREHLKKKVTLLHCTTNYPADFQDINLNAMGTMSNHFDLPVGYSDHSLGILVPLIAATMGAVVVEKHITLDKTLPGPDHSASLEPEELKSMVESIRNIAVIKGSHEKKAAKSEIKNRSIVRRGIYAAKDIKKGDVLTADNLVLLRPENKNSSMNYWKLLSKPSSQNYLKGSAV